MAENTAGETCSIPSKRARSTSSASSSMSSPGNKHLTKIPRQSVESQNTTATSLPTKRRVNPDSLASRLEPDLVRDMNALIVPGNTEMPTFAVRKELQERYNIDRRHIYDYFHSKGLRVVKEDKLNNLVRRTDRSVKVNPRQIRQAPFRGLHVLNETRHKKSFPRVGAKSSTNIRVKQPAKSQSQRIQKPVASATSSHHRQVSDSYLVDPLEISYLTEIEEDSNSHLTFPVNPLFDGFSLTRAIGDVSYSYRAKNVFTRMSELHNLQISSPDASRDITSYSPLPISPETGFMLPLERNPLSSEERMAIYKTLDDNLGAACGIEESVGTYNKYMKEQSRVYFERLFRNSCRTLGSAWHQTGSATLDSDSFASGQRDPVDFRKWLLCGPTTGSSGLTLLDSPLCTMNKAVSPCSTPCKMGKESGTSGHPMADGFDQGPLFCFSPPINRGTDRTFDDLFPELMPCDVYHLHDSMESPVLYSGVSHLSADEEDDTCVVPGGPKSLLRSAESQPAANGLAFTQGRIKNSGNSFILSPSHYSPGRFSPIDQKGDRVLSSIMPNLEEQNNHFRCSVPRADSLFNRTAATREPNFARTRSSGTISARLRTTSAGGGM